MSEDFMSFQQVRCEQCGADLAFEPRTQRATCHYCGHTFDIQAAGEKPVMTPDGIIPFQVSREVCTEQILEWLIQGDETPDDILQGCTMFSIAGAYLPFYWYQGHYTGNYSAVLGFDRQEAYTDHETWWEDHKQRTRPVTRFRTVTDWRPVSGRFQGEFGLLGCASRALQPAQLVFCEDASINPGSILTMNHLYLQGFALEIHDRTAGTIYAGRLKARLDGIIDRDVGQRLSGERRQAVHWDASVAKESSAIYLPFWIASFHYHETHCQVLLDGQDPARIHGERPVDHQRVRRIENLYTPLMAVIVTGTFWIFLCVYLGAHQQDALIKSLTLWAIALGMAEYRKHVMLTTSREARQHTLQDFKARCGGSYHFLPGEIPTPIRTAAPVLSDWLHPDMIAVFCVLLVITLAAASLP